LVSIFENSFFLTIALLQYGVETGEDINERVYPLEFNNIIVEIIQPYDSKKEDQIFKL